MVSLKGYGKLMKGFKEMDDKDTMLVEFLKTFIVIKTKENNSIFLKTSELQLQDIWN